MDGFVSILGVRCQGKTAIPQTPHTHVLEPGRGSRWQLDFAGWHASRFWHL